MSGYAAQPVLAEPVWRPSVALYFFAGGMAGAAAGLGLLARATGNRRLARSCTLAAAAGALASPALLVEDLGRPARFLNMLRVLKPTSPMSVGSWMLVGFGATTAAAAASELTGVAEGAGQAAAGGAALLGLPLATYTAALVANTSVPAWRRARGMLPFLFAAGSAASAGAIAVLTTPGDDAAPARRLAAGGALAEVALARVMTRGLGVDAAPYRSGDARRWMRAAEILGLVGAAGVLAGRRSPVAAAAGAGAVLTGALSLRLAVWRAGPDSARRTAPATPPPTLRGRAGVGDGTPR